MTTEYIKDATRAIANELDQINIQVPAYQFVAQLMRDVQCEHVSLEAAYKTVLSMYVAYPDGEVLPTVLYVLVSLFTSDQFNGLHMEAFQLPDHLVDRDRV